MAGLCEDNLYMEDAALLAEARTRRESKEQSDAHCALHEAIVPPGGPGVNANFKGRFFRRSET
jgi:hypothetical protein